RQGEVIGLVGESGCGKSTLARLIVGLEPPTEGTLTWNEEVLGKSVRNSVKSFHSKIQLVFQDPYSSLNPRQTIGSCIAEVIRTHKLRATEEVENRVTELLSVVGIPIDMKNRFPHQLSGGQRQRVAIARALAAEPDLLVLDEPVSALDVSVRADVMNLLVELKEKFNLTYIFISHDLSMVRHISDAIAVMYLGRIVEMGSWREVLSTPRHPYTRALIESIPDHTKIQGIDFENVLEGEVPDPANLPNGCTFHLRCPIAKPNCRIVVPELQIAKSSHLVACPEVLK
ncbi:MAG: ATP-binding cassette domain-containing protein, partial [Actinobacteria bacterium]|nr:ATP-binding cassette domain-containing protein [Actinomycetota bacterium]